MGSPADLGIKAAKLEDEIRAAREALKKKEEEWDEAIDNCAGLELARDEAQARLIEAEKEFKGAERGRRSIMNEFASAKARLNILELELKGLGKGF